MPVVLEADKMGPVDVAVIAFDGSEFNDEVAPALAELQASGTVKVIDMAFVRKAADGSTFTPETSAMVVVWENSWAARFAADVRASHGRVAMLERIPQENVERAITALDEEPSITAVEE